LEQPAAPDKFNPNPALHHSTDGSRTIRPAFIHPAFTAIVRKANVPLKP